MMYLNERDVEVIFDPVSKGAVLRQGERTMYLDGPFPDFAAAMAAARKFMHKAAGGRAA